MIIDSKIISFVLSGCSSNLNNSWAVTRVEHVWGLQLFNFKAFGFNFGEIRVRYEHFPINFIHILKLEPAVLFLASLSLNHKILLQKLNLQRFYSLDILLLGISFFIKFKQFSASFFPKLFLPLVDTVNSSYFCFEFVYLFIVKVYIKINGLLKLLS